VPLIAAQRAAPILRYVRWTFLAVGVVTLGTVAYSLLDAKVFQVYENWRLNNAAAVSLPSSSRSMPLPVSLTKQDQTRRSTVTAGEMLGRIEIPRIGVNAIVVEGTSAHDLRRAAGHVAGTALPGEEGNVAIAAHRDTFFRELRRIQPQDDITLTTLNGVFHYRVDFAKVVGVDDVDVLRDSNEELLTLVTCYPFYYVGPAPERFVVRAHKL
jgi:sortase A